jgi:hypothetical protein
VVTGPSILGVCYCIALSCHHLLVDVISDVVVERNLASETTTSLAARSWILLFVTVVLMQPRALCC